MFSSDLHGSYFSFSFLAIKWIHNDIFYRNSCRYRRVRKRQRHLYITNRHKVGIKISAGLVLVLKMPCLVNVNTR